MARFKLRNAFKRRIWRRNVTERQVQPQRSPVEFARDIRIFKESGDGGRKCESARRYGVIQRLLADRIARQQQAILPTVPQSESKHTAKLIDKAVKIATTA